MIPRRLQFALLRRLIYMRIKVFRNLASELGNNVTSMYFYLPSIGSSANNFVGDTFSFVNDSSKDIYMTKESSAGKTEETEMVNCFSVSPFNDSVDRGECLIHQS